MKYNKYIVKAQINMATSGSPDTTFNISVTTESDGDIPPGLYIAYNTLSVFLVAFIMLAMGCGITIDAIKPHVKKPIGPLIGLLCQFILMPLLCFSGAHLFQMEPHLAIGFVIVGSCPGGATSNMFTYWCRGDLSLSVTMTACSTVLALFFMPFNTFLYTRSWTEEAAVVPYVNMIIAILLTWIPVGTGIAIRSKFESFADKFIRIGSIIGFVLLCCLGLIQRYAYPEVFDLPWEIWFAAITMPLVGMCMGFGISSIARLELIQKRTIAFETGLQNVGLALALIALSFPGPEASKNSQFPLLYAAFAITDATTIAVFHRTYYRTKGKRTWCHQCYYRSIGKKNKQNDNNAMDVVAADSQPYGPSYELESALDIYKQNSDFIIEKKDLSENSASGNTSDIYTSDTKPGKY